MHKNILILVVAKNVVSCKVSPRTLWVLAFVARRVAEDSRQRKTTDQNMVLCC